MIDLTKEPVFGITLDMDFAPDWMIEACAQILIEHNTRATWFVTHDTPVLEMLRDHPNLFELGIHPDFIKGILFPPFESDILDAITKIVPEAISIRAHNLYQSTLLLTRANIVYGIKVDVSMFMPRVSHLQAHFLAYNGTDLFRVPFFWEDDVEMCGEKPAWTLETPEYNTPGLKLFNFHPVHICLNSPNAVLYKNLLNSLGLQGITKEIGRKCANVQDGTLLLFMQLVQSMRYGGIRIKDIYESYLEDRG